MAQIRPPDVEPQVPHVINTLQRRHGATRKEISILGLGPGVLGGGNGVHCNLLCSYVVLEGPRHLQQALRTHGLVSGQLYLNLVP